ncbi:MAG TPA: hypothetical protein VGM82_20580 [Gemmatimonadaceae bacterium]|jgi:hypothetical protein
MRGVVAVVVMSLGISASARARAQSFDLAGADRETIAQLTRIVESVKAANLPTDPLVAKASLAARVHAPPARMIAAVQAVATHLEDARDALGSTTPTADIIAGADALGTKGVTKDMLQRVRAAQPTRPIAVPIGVLAQLVASGVAPKDAADIVSRLVHAKASNAQLVSLGNDVSQDVSAGAGAGSALQIRLETLKPLLAYGANANLTATSGTQTLADPAGTTTSGTPKSPQNPRGRP